MKRIAILLSTVCCLASTLANAETRHILVELSHGEATWSNPFDNSENLHAWGPAMSVLEGAGFTWRATCNSLAPGCSTFTRSLLDQACVLVVAEPLSEFTDEEVATVLDWVQDGGGLLLANDFAAPINGLAIPTGVEFLLDPRSNFGTVTDITPGHPLTDGVSAIDWAKGAPIALLDSAVTELARFDDPLDPLDRLAPVMAARSFGLGRIVYIGDNETFARFGIFDLDNRTLLENAAEWLCSDCTQRLARECPTDGSYRNHGEYVSCVTAGADQCVADGLISETEKGDIVSEAARSDVGKKK